MAEKKICPKCKGTGINELFRYEYADDRCEVCNGSGKVPQLPVKK